MINKPLIVSRFAEIRSLQNLPRNSFVIFDIDDVLISSEDTIFSPRGEESGIKDLCLRELAKYMPIDWGRKSELTNLLTIFLQNSRRRVIDQSIFSALKKIKETSSYIAITSLEVGSHGSIEDMIEWRKRDLTSLGLDLSAGSPISHIHEFLPFYGKENPFLTDNIIYTDRLDKGATLKIFLDYINDSFDLPHLERPSKIVAIDDLEKNLKSIYNISQELKIECECVLFRGAKDFPIEISTSDAIWQITHLAKNKVWVKDNDLSQHRDALGELR